MQVEPGQVPAIADDEELEGLEYQGEPVSPAMAVIHLFLAALKALYGAASHIIEKLEFLRLAI